MLKQRGSGLVWSAHSHLMNQIQCETSLHSMLSDNLYQLFATECQHRVQAEVSERFKHVVRSDIPRPLAVGGVVSELHAGLHSKSRASDTPCQRHVAQCPIRDNTASMLASVRGHAASNHNPLNGPRHAGAEYVLTHSNPAVTHVGR